MVIIPTGIPTALTEPIVRETRATRGMGIALKINPGNGLRIFVQVLRSGWKEAAVHKSAGRKLPEGRRSGEKHLPVHLVVARVGREEVADNETGEEMPAPNAEETKHPCP